MISNAVHARAAAGLGWLARNRLAGQAMWIAAPFAVQQVVRLGTQVALARLLAPEMFGLMLLVNTLRTGSELLSDIGIGQSIVKSPRGEERPFLNTAWTLQLLRGLLLAAVMVAAAGPVGAIYGQPELTPILLAVSSVFVFTGLQSPGLFLMQKQMRLRARAAYDLISTVFQCVFSIGLALVMPSVWTLVWGLLAGTLFSTVMSYLVVRAPWPKLAWDKSSAAEILHFGKWIFLSTIIFFAAISTDNIYFVAVLPLAVVGVYGVSRTFADAFDQLGNRAGAMLIFPKIAALGEGRAEAAGRLRARRRTILALAALAIAGAMAVSDRVMLLFYDERYHHAAFMLPVMLAAVWFRVLGSFGDSMLMGCGRPAPGAFANGVKFAVLLIGLPLAVSQANLFVAMLVLILAEAGRWAVLAPPLQRERLATIADDLGLTALLVIGAITFKALAGATGLVPTFAEWWALGEALRA